MSHKNARFFKREELRLEYTRRSIGIVEAICEIANRRGASLFGGRPDSDMQPGREFFCSVPIDRIRSKGGFAPVGSIHFRIPEAKRQSLNLFVNGAGSLPVLTIANLPMSDEAKPQMINKAARALIDSLKL